MTDSETNKTETIWDAIFNRTIKSKNLVPFCIIFALTTYLFLGHDSINKRFFILNSLKQEEFAWFSFYALITLTSIGITRLCDKLGIFKAISLFPVLSDVVYYCILDYREMKYNLKFKLIQYYYRAYTGLKERKQIHCMETETGLQKAIEEYRNTHGLDAVFRSSLFLELISEELSLKLGEDKEKEEPHHRVLSDQNLDIKKDFVFKEENGTLHVVNDLALLLILLKHLCTPKHRSNTIEGINTTINNHFEVRIEQITNIINNNNQWNFIKEFKSTQTINQDIQNVISDMIKKSIKWGILEEQKDETISMPRGMVRYFDIIEYGFFYEHKYPILKFIKNHFRLLLIIISQYL
jgi:hypothetical protein